MIRVTYSLSWCCIYHKRNKTHKQKKEKKEQQEEQTYNFVMRILEIVSESYLCCVAFMSWVMERRIKHIIRVLSIIIMSTLQTLNHMTLTLRIEGNRRSIVVFDEVRSNYTFRPKRVPNSVINVISSLQLLEYSQNSK